jgi:hypothetical protein
MAAVVTTLFQGNNKYTINVKGVFSVADETDTIIIDRSTLTGPDGGNVPTYVRIDTITWAVGVGFDYVMLEFDDATDEVIDYFQGQGYFDFRPFGGKKMSAAPTTAAEGDVLLSTAGGAANDTYSFIIECTLKA